eukprot:GFUD01027380.1.p1 GENE.GFUD01027380.1~~GFUD01027380.1.p1  ORF type:complete len:496 (-),score=106.05 GFUD01027380.1:35-1522(-)
MLPSPRLYLRGEESKSLLKLTGCVEAYGALEDTGYDSFNQEEEFDDVSADCVCDDNENILKGTTSKPSSLDYPNPPDGKDGGWGGWWWLPASSVCVCWTASATLSACSSPPHGGHGVCQRGGVSAAGSFQVGVYSLTSLVSARLVTKHGARPVCIVGALIAATGLLVASYSWNMASLMISYSFITGVGFGLMYIPAVIAVAQQFTTRQAFAIGVCVCGSGMGTFILAPLEHFLLGELGWRWTFVLMAGLCWLCTLCGAAMTPVHQPRYQEGRSATPPSCLTKCISMVLSEELLSSPALYIFLLICIADCIASMALYIPFTFLPDEATYSGVSLEDASFLIAGMGISSSAGRICSGWVCDRAWCNPVVLTAVMVAAASIPPLLFPWISNYVIYLSLSCLFGFLTGVWIAATSPILVRVLGLSLLSPAFGLMTAMQGAAALTGPPLAGAAVDWAGDRGVALHLAGGVMCVAAVGYGLAYLVLRREERKSTASLLTLG